MFPQLKIPPIVYKIVAVVIIVVILTLLLRSPTTDISTDRLDKIGIGTSTHLRAGIEGLDGAYRQLEDLNIHWVREEIPWAEVELTPGEFRWNYGFGSTYRDFNQMLIYAQDHNLEILALLSTGPVYLPHQYPDQSVDSDQIIKRWQAYVQTVVDRFGDQINYWEIGTEENNPSQWAKVVFPTTPNAVAEPSPFLYTRMLTIANQIIKQHDPNDVVVLGGLYSSPTNDCNSSIYWYMTELKNAGAWDDFDVIAIHPYWENNPPEAWMDRGPGLDVESGHCQEDIRIQANFQEEIEKVTGFANQYGGKPIWITELGWQENWLTTMAVQQNVPTDQIESNFVVRSIIPLLTNPQVRKVFWNSYYEDPARPGFVLGSSGKQSLSNIAKLLGGARVVSDGKINNQIGQNTGLFEYRFRKEGRTIVYLWTASGGTTPYLITLTDLPGKQYRAYPADTSDLSSDAGIIIETNNDDEITLYINEIPVILVQDNVNIIASLQYRLSDGMVTWWDEQQDELNIWADAQIQKIGDQALNWAEKAFYKLINWVVDQIEQ